MTDERKNKITFSVIATVVIALHVAIFVQGCGSATADRNYKAEAAAVLAAEIELGGKSPAPVPTPTPSGKCSNCNGTGRLGDGTINVKCPVCDGTGEVQSDEGKDSGFRPPWPEETKSPHPEDTTRGVRQPLPETVSNAPVRRRGWRLFRGQDLFRGR